ncbi:uncharacterized membrane protein YgdD (TMEM256/DUF423 family) [Christiangramia gaetbulicola]|uniref:Uncharacterized membrane protein YgdD (TMEM256/DUF423 family) n=1 Tax=Christiangramia gaetbulicola TaxID=703340 RepID=A0A2T6AHM5_9FLAO|nr:DUF423 domain-containing protein [Christiangramia gaetbulicola]PTX43302.1 uncharacterized membrane protein YgdD (TMEM256/DUF423 family) [Christiangramia gaetbulicola]
MKELVLIIGGSYGGLSVILGAFGAHALKKKFNEDQLKSFETGVKYQMYHAIVLIICGITFPFLSGLQNVMAWCFIIGILLFSFSIYGLTWSSSQGKKIKILGPITPLGGLLLLAGWVLLTINLADIAMYINP